MKRNLLGMCLVALLACAGTASADVLAEDSAANYTEESFVNGANLGSGFGAWEFPDAEPELADSAAGECGDINSANGLSFRIARNAGTDWGHVYRGFEALNPGDVMTLKFSCAWDGGGRGIDLYADGDKIVNAVNLGPGNKLSVNDETVSEVYAGKAVCELALVQETDGIKIALTRVPADEGGEGNVAYWTKIETDKKLSRIGFYAGGWDWADGANVDNYALFVNDLKIEGEPPTDTLTLAGAWEVTEKETELPFKVTRQNSEGTLDVALVSSYPEFASVPNLVTIANGDTEVSFTVTATLQGRGNVATISASAEGVTGASFEVKGPNYRVNNGSETPVSFLADESADIWINWDGGARDDSKLALTAEPEDVISVPTDWTLPAEGDVYVQSSVTALAPGDAALVLSYDGIEMARCDFTVLTPGLSLSGPATANTGSTKVYTLTGILKQGLTDCELSISPENAASADIESPFDLQDFDAENNCYKKDISLTFGDYVGDVTLSVTYLDVYSASCTTTVSKPVDPSDFDDFIAYDEASLYSGGFDYDAVGAGSDKFQAWQNDYIDSDDETKFAGATIVDSAPDEAVLSDGTAFAIYANGADGAEIKLLRPFVNALAPGQAFSLQVSPNYRDGEKSVRLSGTYDGVWYDRVVFSFDNGGYYYSIDYGENVSLGWEYGTKAIAITLQRAADGSSYSLAFAREGDETVTVGDFTLPGSVDGVIFRSRNGGFGAENNVVFNRLAIEQVEEPVVERKIGWGDGVYNPEGDGTYTITLTATTDDIGEVAISVDPAEGALSLASDTIDLSGATSATITYTLAGAQKDDTFRISATPVDTTVAALEGEGAYEVKVIEPYLLLWCNDGGEFTTDTKEIWLSLSASPSLYGTYTLQSSDSSVIKLSVDSLTIPNDEGNSTVWFNVFVQGVGNATVSVVEDETANWNFTITQGAAEPAELPAYTLIPGRGLAWKVSELDGIALYGADSLVGKAFPDDWSELKADDDYVIEGEGEEAQLIVLFDGAFFAGKSVGFIAPK